MRTALSTEFRFIFLGNIGVIVPFGLLLTLLPNETATYWAWVIPQPRSAMLIGAAYFGAIFYYVLALKQNDWLQVENGLGGLILFSLVLLVATMANWNTFRPYHPLTLVWLAFYYAGPFFVPIAYRAQLARSGRAQLTGPRMAPIARAWLMARGFFYGALALLGIIFTSTLSTVWPWLIQPLEVQVFMGQVAVVGWGGIAALKDGLVWRRHRLGLLITGAIGVIQVIGQGLNRTAYDLSAPLGIGLPLMFVEWILTPLLMFFIYERRRA